MKKALFLIVSSILISASLGWASLIQNVTSSALMEGDSVNFNADLALPFDIPDCNVTLNAKLEGQETDYFTPMTRVDHDPYYVNTYEGVINFDSPAGAIQYYAQMVYDTLTITQSYFCQTDQFPPASVFYAPLAKDPTGDVLPGTKGDWLDLTGSAVTYSNTKIYGWMNNVSGTWTTIDVADFFIYGFFIMNPDGPGTGAVAMIYADVPFTTLKWGLFHVDMNMQSPNFRRIGDIEYGKVDGSLHMSCNISDILKDQEFWVWPPESGFVQIACVTLTVSMMKPYYNDFTYKSSFIPCTQFLNAEENWAPDFLSHEATQIDSSVTIKCMYWDGDNNLPVEKNLFFDIGVWPKTEGVYEMGSFDHIYDDEAEFEVTIKDLEEGWHYYHCRFSDGLETIETSLDSILIDYTDVDEKNPVPTSFVLKQNYPNPFNAETSIGFELVSKADVNLTIYDLSGRKVAVLIDDCLEAGGHNVIWNGKNDYGQNVSSGVYFYKISVGDQSLIKRMLLLK